MVHYDKTYVKEILEDTSTNIPSDISDVETKVDTLDANLGTKGAGDDAITLLNSVDSGVDEVWSKANVTDSIVTRESSLNFAGGIGLINESVSVTGSGATTINVFKITGCVVIQELGATITSVSDSTTFSDVKFTVYDGSVSANLTATVDGSNAIAGSKFYKTAVVGTALTYLKSDQVRVIESAFNKPFVETIVNSKTGSDTYIVFNFTGDASTDVTMNFVVRWSPICLNGKIETV